MARSNPDCMTLVEEAQKCCRDMDGNPWPPGPMPRSSSSGVMVDGRLAEGRKALLRQLQQQHKPTAKHRQTQKQKKQRYGKHGTRVGRAAASKPKHRKAEKSGTTNSKHPRTAQHPAQLATWPKVDPVVLSGGMLLVGDQSEIVAEVVNHADFDKHSETALHQDVVPMPHTAPSMPEWVPRLAVCTFAHNSTTLTQLKTWVQYHMCALAHHAWSKSLHTCAQSQSPNMALLHIHG